LEDGRENYKERSFIRILKRFVARIRYACVPKSFVHTVKSQDDFFNRSADRAIARTFIVVPPRRIIAALGVK
jgi:hypothetical protein